MTISDRIAETPGFMVNTLLVCFDLNNRVFSKIFLNAAKNDATVQN